jgi:peptidoglycan LD-endopeptidase LytH
VKRLLLLAVVIGILAAAAWLSRAQVLRVVPTPALPIAAHDQYAIALRWTGLASSPEGRAWAAAADRAFMDPPRREGTFSSTGELAADAGAVLAWQFSARRGQRLAVSVAAPRDTVFLDLFSSDGKTRIASAPPRSTTLTTDVDRDGEFVIRMQPRLGTASATAYTIEQRLTASLLFPVQGLSGRAVQSGFGTARDSGRRRHEGIDIFAARGTPVVAGVDGWITRQTSNRLGGKVVWVWAPSRGISLYYAHLDEQLVAPGERVRAGDVLGTVGNTGNARGTSPHLHFGIYALGGAVDPFPFVVDPVMHRRRAETNQR